MPSIAPFITSCFIIECVVNSASFIIVLLDNSCFNLNYPSSLVFVAVVGVETGSCSIQIV